MKRIFLAAGLLFTGLHAQPQRLLFTSPFGGINSNGALVNYNLETGQFENSVSLEGNPLAPSNIYSTGFSADDEYDFEFELGGLLTGSDGYIYGTEYHAGVAANSMELGTGSGILYRFHPDTKQIEVLHAFTASGYLFNDSLKVGALENGYSQPRFNLIEGQPGVFYGICIAGGSENRGGIWKFDMSDWSYSQLGDFTDAGIGYDPTSALFQGPNDDLYGVVSQRVVDGGHLYKLELSSGSLSYVSELEGVGIPIFDPFGSVAYEASTNRMFGVKRFELTQLGGGVYWYDLNSGDIVNHVRIAGGWDVLGSDMRGMVRANDGNKYAITARDAANNHGAILLYSEATQTLTVMHNFDDEPNGNAMLVHGTKIYGTYNNILNDTKYNMWSYDVTTGVLQNFFPTSGASGLGIMPQFAIANNKLYARTLDGNSTHTGYIVEIDLNNMTISNIIEGHSPNGSVAVGELLNMGNGEFLGFTQTDGSTDPAYANFEGNIVRYGLGNSSAVYVTSLELIPDNVITSTIYGPISYKAPKMTMASNGKVYFTYASYGNPFFSVLYDSYLPQLVLCELDLTTNQINIINSTNENSFGIVSSVLEYEPGKLMFTAGNRIKVYNTNTANVDFNEIRMDFQVSGAFYGNTILASNRLIYGYTRKLADISQHARSKIYSLDPANNFTWSEVHVFDSIINEANLGLTEYNGKLYGSTASGGTNNHGYIFSYNLTTSTFSVEHDFNAAQDGAAFEGGWTAYNDRLYSTSFAGGQNGYGTIAEFDPATSSLNVLKHLTFENGRPFKGTPHIYNGPVPVYAGNDNTLSVCNSAGDLDFVTLLQAPDAGGQWNDNNNSGVNLSDPTHVDVSGLITGTYKFSHTVANDTNSTATLTLHVTAIKDPGLDNTVSICDGGPDTILDLFASIAGTPDSGGSWVDLDNSTVILSDPSKVDFNGILPGKYHFRYTLPAAGPCAAVYSTVTVNVNLDHNAGTNATVLACNGPGISSVDLFRSLGDTPDSGGSWTDNDNSGVSLADPGKVSFSGISEGSYRFTYTLTGTGTCGDVSSVLTVNVVGGPDAGMDNSVNLCDNGRELDLFASLGGNPDTGGTWTDENNTGVDLNDPTAVDFTGLVAGKYSYKYSVSGGTVCNVSEAYVVVNIDQAHEGGSDGIVQACSDKSVIDLESVIGNPDPGGTWSDNDNSGLNLSDPTKVAIDDLNSGSYVFTYTIAGTNGCSSVSSKATVTVSTPLSAGSNATIKVCNTSGNIDLFSSIGGSPVTGGHWADIDKSGINLSNPGSVSFLNVPPGEYHYSYAVGEGTVCGTSSVILVVELAKELNAGDNTFVEVCSVDANEVDLRKFKDAKADGGGVWREKSGFLVDLVNPASVDLSAPGTYVFEYHFDGSNNCAASSADITIESVDLPNAGTGQKLSVKNDGSTLNLFDGLSSDHDDGGTWTSLDSEVDISNPMQVTFNREEEGSYVFTYTVESDGPCIAIDATDMIVTVINAVEVVGISEGFSPNGDGINDEWEILDIGNYPGNIVKVYNRWGDLVFQEVGYDNQNKVFRGRSNVSATYNFDDGLPAGTYFYTIEIPGIKSYSGFITILR